MGSDSLILIDEAIVPNSGAHQKIVGYDLTMMTSLAAMERTEAQWYALLEKAGLKIREIYQYCEDTHDSVIVAVPVPQEA